MSLQEISLLDSRPTLSPGENTAPLELQEIM
jgi:hypothetical protein